MKGSTRFLIILALAALTSCKVSNDGSGSVSPSNSDKTNLDQDQCMDSTSSIGGAITTKVFGTTTAPYGFLEYLPADYATSGKDYPVILFLHGAGEQGQESGVNAATNLYNKMVVHGPMRRIREGRHFPAIVFAPQSNGWWNSATVKNFLIWIETNYRVNTSRIYVTGLSMGGGGTFDYLRHDPDRIAAAIPICAAAGANNSPSERDALRSVPHIAVHNVNDGTVGYGNSVGFANSLGAELMATNTVLQGYTAGTNVTVHFDEASQEWIKVIGSRKFKDANGEFPALPYIYAFDALGGHDAWTKTYASEETWEWLFCQKK